MEVSKITSNLSTTDSFVGLGKRERAPFDQNKKQQEQEDVFNKKNIQQAVDNINKFIEPVNTNLKFQLHEDLHEYYVTVVDPITDEVIKEIPPKKMLDMYVDMVKYMGLLVDEKV